MCQLAMSKYFMDLILWKCGNKYIKVNSMKKLVDIALIR